VDFDTYSMNMGHSVLGVVTGKPLAIGGVPVGRTEATAAARSICIRTAIMKQGGRSTGLAFGVQGFGRSARTSPGCSPTRGPGSSRSPTPRCVANPYGIDVRAAIAHKGEHGVLTGLPGTEAITTRS